MPPSVHNPTSKRLDPRERGLRLIGWERREENRFCPLDLSILVLVRFIEDFK